MKNSQHNLIKKNKKPVRHKLLFCVITLLLVPVFFLAKTAFTGIAQIGKDKEKIIKKVSFENEPIEFLGLVSNEKNIKSDERFIQDDNWLKGLTIRFKNISDKPITYVSIAILFPETGSDKPPQVYFLRSGVRPEMSSRGEPKLLNQNDIAEVALDDKTLNHLKSILPQGRQISELTQADFRIMSVYFEDGTKWAAGTMFRPDPKEANKFVPINKKSMEEKE